MAICGNNLMKIGGACIAASIPVFFAGMLGGSHNPYSWLIVPTIFILLFGGAFTFLFGLSRQD